MPKKLTRELFIERSIKIHNNKYDYSKVEYINGSSKVVITCPIHADFEQTPANHLRGQGCKKCGIKKRALTQRLTTQQFIVKAEKVHKNKYNYSKVKYVNTVTPVTIICVVHGPFLQRPDKHLSGRGCVKCGKGILNTTMFIDKAINVHGNKYDYSRTVYVNTRSKVEIVCPEHGSFLQRPEKHLKGIGCSVCASHSKTEAFITKARKVHGNKYDYSKVVYKDGKSKVIILCKKHGEFTQTPSVHLRGSGCIKCTNSRRITKKVFLAKAGIVHGNKYNYSKVKYINLRTKISIICPIHGEFKQAPREHLKGHGCAECAGVAKLDTEKFIAKALRVHGNKYDYTKVRYISSSTKITIICATHGEFEQSPSLHLYGQGCPHCCLVRRRGASNGNWKGGVHHKKLPLYSTYKYQLEPYQNVYCIVQGDLHLLGVECMYCGKVFVPNINEVVGRVAAIQNINKGEVHFYCSGDCKKACPTYGKVNHPEEYKPASSREVQPELRKLVLSRDKYTCQKCGLMDAELHCHHIDPVSQNPIESADMDNCVTLCKKCHIEVHKLPDCGYNELRCI